MDTDRRRPWQRNIAATDKARRVLEAIGWPLSDRYTWALGQRLEDAATNVGSIVGVIVHRQDQETLAALHGPVDHYTFPEIAAARDDLIERVTRQTRTAKAFRERFGPPEYLFVGRLYDIYRRYFHREPGVGHGPFFRFVNAAKAQFGEGTEPVTQATLRKAVERRRDDATWPF